MIVETLVGVALAATSWLGAVRLSRAKNRVEKAKNSYEQLQIDLDQSHAKRSDLLKSLGNLAAHGVRHVVVAQKMLTPLRANWSGNPISLPGHDERQELALRKSEALSVEFYAAASVVTGAATAGALWVGAQAIGIASTGMPIVFLHGAALHNAALACLGGGALKAGGAGMLGGSVVLASAVVVPAALYFGYKTHSEASKLNSIAEEIEHANSSNLQVLDNSRCLNRHLEQVEAEVSTETERYSREVINIHRKLFRFGILSHYWRKMRAKWWGTYYKNDDMELTDMLSTATLRYTSLFEKFKQQPFNSVAT